MIQCHTFIPVAHHWENEVTWHCTKSPYPHSSCLVFPDGHRQKEGWYPRRTVDYQNLNAQCLRETHPCESPFHLASRVPPTTKKTVINLSCCWTWRRKSTLNGDVICICECPRGSQVLAMLTLVGATTSKMSVQKGKNHTCLQTDWCEHGIGYLLLQKHCSCHDQSQVTCCPTSWKLIFTLPAEIRYKATEGEALAVSWSLKHSRMFTTFKNVYYIQECLLHSRMFTLGCDISSYLLIMNLGSESWIILGASLTLASRTSKSQRLDGSSTLCTTQVNGIRDQTLCHATHLYLLLGLTIPATTPS